MNIISPTTSDELWRQYLACRYENLYRPFNLPESCTTSELDSPRDRPGVLHRCVLDAAGVVAAVSRLDLQPAHALGPSAQVRYFAVNATSRGTGVGQALLTELERLAVANGIGRVWMEARVAALNFYLRAGYMDIGEGPNKWGVIPHRVLEKRVGM